MAERFRAVVRTVMKLLGVTRLFREGLRRRQNIELQYAEATETKEKYKVKRRTFKNVGNEIIMKQKALKAFLEEIKPPAEFKPVFETRSEREAKKQKLETVEEEKKNILKDLPEMDDEEIAEFVATELTGRFLNSKIFRRGIVAVIILNSLMIAIETDEKLQRQYSHIFTIMDECIMTIFVCEILMKWYHGFIKFWTQGWNIFDFCIVASLLFGPLFLDKGTGSRGVLRILRVLRAFRSLRSVSSLPGLQVVVQTILHSVPDMANIVMLLVIIMLVFSVIGITLFRDIVPKHFGDLSLAMFSLFICLTQDGWVEIFKEFEKKGDINFAAGGLFLILFISIGAFIFANLVVAVVVTNLEVAVLDVRKEEKENAKEHELKGISEMEESDNIMKIVSDSEIPSYVFKKQEPLFLPDFTNLSVERLENYLLIVSAMEDNCAEYLKIKEELSKIFTEVVAVNEHAQKELLLAGEQTLGGRRKASSLSISAETGTLMSGDIASGLMAMESSHLICSHDKTLDQVINQSAESFVHQMMERRHEKRRRSSAKQD